MLLLSGSGWLKAGSVVLSRNFSPSFRKVPDFGKYQVVEEADINQRDEAASQPALPLTGQNNG
jgi:hypothetical protein